MPNQTTGRCWLRILCSLLLFFKLVVAQNPTVTIMATDPPSLPNNLLISFRDNDLTMDCYVENLMDTSLVRWQRNYIDQSDGTAKTQSISQDLALEDNIHYGIEKPTQYTWRLRVRGAQVADDGNYTCFVQLTQITRAWDYRTVDIVVAPYLDPQQTSPDTSVNEGDNLDLICNATGLPNPTILWSRLGGALLPVGLEVYEGPILHLTNIQADDRGVYRCTAINAYGTTIQNINLFVSFQPYITLPRSMITQAVGYRAELQCFVEANPLPYETDASWLVGTTTYSVTSSRYQVNWFQGAFDRVMYELVITNVQSTDFGTYTCRIKNSFGTNTAKIVLSQSSTPTASIKLNRVIPGNEDPALFTSSAVSPKRLVLLSVVSLLLAILMTW